MIKKNYILSTSKAYVRRIYFLLFIILTSFSVFLGAGDRNLLLISIMGICSVMAFPSILKYRNGLTNILLILILFSVFIPLFLSSIRWATILYTCMYFLFCVYLINQIDRAYFDASVYCKFIEFVLLAYAIVLLLQQICVLTGLPIINGIKYGSKEVVTIYRLNSLSPEPSHTVRYVGILLLSHIIIGREFFGANKYSLYKEIKINYKAWIPFLYIVIGSGSGTGVLIFLLIASLFMSWRNILFIIIVIVGGIFALSFLNYNPIERTLGFLTAILTGDTQKMMVADHSASVRIVPFIIAIHDFHPFSINGIIGMGPDYMSSILSKLMTGLPEGASGGGLATLFLERGLIIGSLYTYFSLKISIINGYRLITFSFWILCVALTPINTPLPWAFMLLSYLNKILISRREEISI